ncbi:MAG: phosphoenolpyruvate carboxykinase [Bacteroidales bacterium]|nr:phosphoenolpyruvate carboxykinase [Bacteroidales bacterium]
MMQRYTVAGITFAVTLPEGVDASVLPSFAPFVANVDDAEDAFRFDAAASLALPEDAECIVTDSNDMGESRVLQSSGWEGFYVELTFAGASHLMRVDPSFRHGEGYLNWDDPYAGMVLGSMLRITFAQVALSHEAISLHASCVANEANAYLFMGASGTGKSTHSRLWMKAFPGTLLLNDDNPVIRVEGDVVRAYGTPWSGKTHCYKNLSFPVAGIVRLSQAPANAFVQKQDIEAFLEVYQGSSVLRTDETLHGQLCDTLMRVIELVKIGHLECLPDEDAARVCRDGLKLKR